jgi:hypothetical protein
MGRIYTRIWENDIKMDLNEHDVYCNHLTQWLPAETGSETSGYINSWGYIDEVSSYQFFKDFAALT